MQVVQGSDPNQYDRTSDFLAGRVALKNALKQYLSKNKIDLLNLGEINIKNFESGQPYIESYENLHCSISHSYGLGIGAVAPFRIGVDIEKIRPHKDSLATYIAEDKELDLVQDFFHSHTDKITLVWTIKESVMKALGVGFKISPKRVKITKRINNFFEVKVLDSTTSYWYVWSIDTGDCYISIAYEKKHGQKTYVDWDSKISISFANA
jgi:phosphopantetheinyl transferase